MKREFLKNCQGWILGAVVTLGTVSSVRADHGGPPEPVAKPGSSADASSSINRRGVDQTLALIREAALALLKEGNQRYATGKSKHPNQDAARRSVAVAEGQKPFATILACSDSRSPVEVIFDRGVGDLFVVRVAGNVADESQIATIEYGVEHLGTPLLVVMGHTGCGAVTAACKGGEVHGHLGVLLSKIQPAVVKAAAVAESKDRLVPAAIQANVWQQMEDVVQESSILREKIKEGALQVVGAVYDLEKGSVTWLGSHPSMDSLIVEADKAEREKAALAARTAAQEDTSRPQAHTAEVTHETDDPHANSNRSSGSSAPLFPATLLPSKEVKARAPQKSPAHEEHHEH